MRAVLEAEGQARIPPFSDFPLLYKQLTEGDWAAIEPTRLKLAVTSVPPRPKISA